MPFELPADPGDPGRPSSSVGRVDGSGAISERRLLRDGVQVLAHGALVCPECALPIAIRDSVAPTATVRCGFCNHAGTARGFLVEDVYDTVGNEVQLVARFRRLAAGT